MSSTQPSSKHKRHRTPLSAGREPAVSRSGPSLPKPPDFPRPRTSKRKPVSASAQDQRHLASLVRKFHEFICEFDRGYKILSIWSSNSAVSIQVRRRLVGENLLT